MKNEQNKKIYRKTIRKTRSYCGIKTCKPSHGVSRLPDCFCNKNCKNTALKHQNVEFWGPLKSNKREKNGISEGTH